MELNIYSRYIYFPLSFNFLPGAISNILRSCFSPFEPEQ